MAKKITKEFHLENIVTVPDAFHQDVDEVINEKIEEILTENNLTAENVKNFSYKVVLIISIEPNT